MKEFKRKQNLIEGSEKNANFVGVYVKSKQLLEFRSGIFIKVILLLICIILET